MIRLEIYVKCKLNNNKSHHKKQKSLVLFARIMINNYKNSMQMGILEKNSLYVKVINVRIKLFVCSVANILKRIQLYSI